MYPCDLTFHITTLARAGGRQGWGQRGRRAGCPSERPAPPSRRTSPTPTTEQRQTKAAPPPLIPQTPQSHGHPYSTSHSSVGFSRMCPEPVLNGCLPPPPPSVSAWEVSPEGRPGAGWSPGRSPWPQRLTGQSAGAQAAGQLGPCPHPAPPHRPWPLGQGPRPHPPHCCRVRPWLSGKVDRSSCPLPPWLE